MEASLTTRVPGSPGGIESASAELERFSDEQGLTATAVWPFHSYRVRESMFTTALEKAEAQANRSRELPLAQGIDSGD